MSAARPDPRRATRGFTLVELLAVIAISVVVFATSTRLMMASTRVFARETANVRIAQDLAAAKNIFLDDMSIAGYAGNGAKLAANAVFVSVTTQTASDAVTFEGDVNSDGATERMCYQISGGSLVRKVVATGTACGTTGFETLVDNVNTFTLTFLDSTRTVIPSANAGNIVNGTAIPHYVRLNLTLNPDTPGITAAKTIQGEVALRNW
jgi:prepilin-type N-terminal cleavage/methylation domain-containing protein